MHLITVAAQVWLISIWDIKGMDWYWYTSMYTPWCNLVTNSSTCNINIERPQVKEISQKNAISKIGLSVNWTTDKLPTRLYIIMVC